MMDIFAEPLLVKRILYGLSSNELCARAGKDEIPNKLGVPLYHTGIKSRSAAFTEIIYEPNDEQMRRIREVEGHLRQAELICVERNIGQNQVNTFKVRYYVTKDYARLAYMFHENFFPPSEGVEPDILVIDVPEWPERKVYVCPRQKVTFILGTDYYGEAKMASLRHAMHIMREERDGLGVHAGSKLYRFFIDGELVEKGALIFGLSGTGKTTITCNDHHLSPPEGIQILQDDINMLTREASIYGTERNFYIKTDSIMEQPGLLRAASDPGAILENVYVDEDGEVDFNNFSVSTNGRAITPRHKILHTAESIDLPRLDIVLLIARRYDIPPAGRLRSAAQAAAFLTLGESTITSADDPHRVGEAKRVVAFDPFIVGGKHKNGNRFYEILDSNPHIECYLLSTGKVGGVDRGVKIPPDVTTRIVEGMVRGTIHWEYDPILGYDAATYVEGVGMDIFDPYRIYGRGEFERLMRKLRHERREHLGRFPGLYDDIVAAFS